MSRSRSRIALLGLPVLLLLLALRVQKASRRLEVGGPMARDRFGVVIQLCHSANRIQF